ncbi:MAG TPA: methyltransferase domain-containing protein [Candidatus Binataceae bacterium]|nr:methyltransferase domain-containing protein [Candidatus Binataceae bacterium]
MAEPHESRVYSDFSHFYDAVFGRAFVDREHKVIAELPFRAGNRVLEVGVGTGISLDAYPSYVQLTGIDYSSDMLKHAVEKIRENDWRHINVQQGNALALDFPDNSFDWVTSFHVITVVPDPRQMMAEMVRVCRPGGRIVVISHFASPKPWLYALGSLVNPVTKLLGWTTRLRARDVLEGQPIDIEHHARPHSLAVHFVLIARKRDDGQLEIDVSSDDVASTAP